MNCRVKLTSAKGPYNSRIGEFRLPGSALRCVEEVDSTDTPMYADRQHSKNRLILLCIRALCSTCNICLTNDEGLVLFTFRGLSRLSSGRGIPGWRARYACTWQMINAVKLVRCMQAQPRPWTRQREPVNPVWCWFRGAGLPYTLLPLRILGPQMWGAQSGLLRAPARPSARGKIMYVTYW